MEKNIQRKRKKKGGKALNSQTLFECCRYTAARHVYNVSMPRPWEVHATLNFPKWHTAFWKELCSCLENLYTTLYQHYRIALRKFIVSLRCICSCFFSFSRSLYDNDWESRMSIQPYISIYIFLVFLIWSRGLDGQIGVHDIVVGERSQEQRSSSWWQNWRPVRRHHQVATLAARK